MNMQKNNSIFNVVVRSTAAFTAFTFIFTSTVGAAPILPQPEFTAPIQISVPPINIPSEFAHVEKVVGDFSDKHPSFIYIQDAHSNYDAQLSMKALLKHLKENEGIDLVLVEGASSNLDSKRLKFFPEDKINQDIADKLARKGNINGLELFLLESDDSVKALGVEDPVLYAENLKAFRRVIKVRPKTESFLNSVRAELDRLSNHLLNRELRSFVHLFESYRTDTLDLKHFLTELKNQAKTTLDINLEDPVSQIEYPQLHRFVLLTAIQEKINPKKLEDESKKLAGQLDEWGVGEELKNQIEDLLRSRGVPPRKNDTGRDGRSTRDDSINPRKVLEHLYSAAVDKGFAFENYPLITEYTRQLTLQDELEPISLSKEMNTLSFKVREGLISKDSSKNEKEVLNLLDDLFLLDNAVSLSLEKDSLDQFRSNLSNLNPTSVVSRLVSLSTKAGLPLNESEKILERSAKLNGFLEAINAFYTGTEKRDEVIVKKALDLMKKEKRSKAVLITGGFHTGPIGDLLQSHKASYMVITPRIKEIDVNRTNYYSTVMEDEIMSLRGPKDRSNLKDETASSIPGTFPRSDVSNIMPMVWLQAGLDRVINLSNGNPDYPATQYLTAFTDVATEQGLSVKQIRSINANNGSFINPKRLQVKLIGKDSPDITTTGVSITYDGTKFAHVIELQPVKEVRVEEVLRARATSASKSVETVNAGFGSSRDASAGGIDNVGKVKNLSELLNILTAVSRAKRVTYTRPGKASRFFRNPDAEGDAHVIEFDEYVTRVVIKLEDSFSETTFEGELDIGKPLTAKMFTHLKTEIELWLEKSQLLNAEQVSLRISTNKEGVQTIKGAAGFGAAPFNEYEYSVIKIAEIAERVKPIEKVVGSFGKIIAFNPIVTTSSRSQPFPTVPHRGVDSVLNEHNNIVIARTLEETTGTVLGVNTNPGPTWTHLNYVVEGHAVVEDLVKSLQATGGVHVSDVLASEDVRGTKHNLIVDPKSVTIRRVDIDAREYSFIAIDGWFDDGGLVMDRVPASDVPLPSVTGSLMERSFFEGRPVLNRPLRVAFNGVGGRMGVTFLRQVLLHNDPSQIQIIAVNGRGIDPKTKVNELDQVLKHDTEHGEFPLTIKTGKDESVDLPYIEVGGQRIYQLNERGELSRLPWKKLDIDVVIDGTAPEKLKTDRRGNLMEHIKAGAKMVLRTSPIKEEDAGDYSLLVGVNHAKFPLTVEACDVASCTTNSYVPPMYVLNQGGLQVVAGDLRTVHAMTNTQALIDTYKDKAEKGRAAARNMIPAKTGADEATGKILPFLKGRLKGSALRVPTGTGSLSVATNVVKISSTGPLTAEMVNAHFKKFSKQPAMKGIIGTAKDLVSSQQIVGASTSSILVEEGTQVTAIGDGHYLVRTLHWYDNEWGYSARVVDALYFLGNVIESTRSRYETDLAGSVQNLINLAIDGKDKDIARELRMLNAPTWGTLRRNLDFTLDRSRVYARNAPPDVREKADQEFSAIKHLAKTLENLISEGGFGNIKVDDLRGLDASAIEKRLKDLKLDELQVLKISVASRFKQSEDAARTDVTDPDGGSPAKDHRASEQRHLETIDAVIEGLWRDKAAREDSGFGSSYIDSLRGMTPVEIRTELEELTATQLHAIAKDLDHKIGVLDKARGDRDAAGYVADSDGHAKSEFFRAPIAELEKVAGVVAELLSELPADVDEMHPRDKGGEGFGVAAGGLEFWYSPGFALLFMAVGLALVAVISLAITFVLAKRAGMSVRDYFNAWDSSSDFLPNGRRNRIPMIGLSAMFGAALSILIPGLGIMDSITHAAWLRSLHARKQIKQQVEDIIVRSGDEGKKVDEYNAEIMMLKTFEQTDGVDTSVEVLVELLLRDKNMDAPGLPFVRHELFVRAEAARVLATLKYADDAARERSTRALRHASKFDPSEKVRTAAQASLDKLTQIAGHAADPDVGGESGFGISLEQIAEEEFRDRVRSDAAEMENESADSAKKDSEKLSVGFGINLPRSLLQIPALSSSPLITPEGVLPVPAFAARFITADIAVGAIGTAAGFGRLASVEYDKPTTEFLMELFGVTRSEADELSTNFINNLTPEVIRRAVAHQSLVNGTPVKQHPVFLAIEGGILGTDYASLEHEFSHMAENSAVNIFGPDDPKLMKIVSKHAHPRDGKRGIAVIRTNELDINLIHKSAAQRGITPEHVGVIFSDEKTLAKGVLKGVSLAVKFNSRNFGKYREASKLLLKDFIPALALDRELQQVAFVLWDSVIQSTPGGYYQVMVEVLARLYQVRLAKQLTSASA